MDKEPVLLERRKYPRINIDLPIKVYPKDIPFSIETETIDISEGGIRFSSLRDLDLPNNLTLGIRHSVLPCELKISTEVRWRDNSYYGAQFKRDEKKQINDIKKILWLCEEYIDRQIENLLIKADKIRSGIRRFINSFFTSDVKKYLENISIIFIEVQNNKKTDETGYIEITHLTNNILRKGEELTKKINNKLLAKEIKNTFRLMTGSWIYESTHAKRFLEKPRGYPGDYKMLEAIYNNKPVSEDIGYYFDKFLLNNSYSGPVRSRKDKIVKILGDFLANSSLSSIRILNLASGSCREIKELFEKFSLPQRKMEFTCVDHDEEALTFSQEVLKGVPENVKVNFIKENILIMPDRQQSYAELLGRQNLIYSLGLIDYVPDRILKRIIRFWYSLLVPGGQLILTHKDRGIDPEAPFVPDWICDWEFVPRNEDHFINLVKDSIDGTYSFKLDRDESGKIIFLFVNNK